MFAAPVAKKAKSETIVKDLGFKQQKVLPKPKGKVAAQSSLNAKAPEDAEELISVILDRLGSADLRKIERAGLLNDV